MLPSMSFFLAALRYIIAAVMHVVCTHRLIAALAAAVGRFLGLSIRTTS